nr:SGNH/GDSL hydrolase family protein [uncultured Allomuricauda sp.]
MGSLSRRNTLKILGAIACVSFFPLKSMGKTINKGCDVCRKAWSNLSKFATKRYPFRYIEPVDSLPKVFIYGDSISIAYTEYVRASFEDKACVFRIYENGSSSNEFIKKMEAMRQAMFQPHLSQGWGFEWDVIHFNVGLHDLKYVVDGKLDKQNGTQVSSLETYEKNLRSIINYLKAKYPKAKLVFATTTPVPEGERGRNAGDAKRYNTIALKVMNDHKDILINDLYKFSIPVLEEFAVGPGNVHFKAEGSRLQGIEVARVISDVIGVKPIMCPTVETIKERSSQYERKI